MIDENCDYKGTILDSVKPVKIVNIKAECTSIRGESEKNYAFYGARNTIENCYFEEGSKLKTIQNYAFYKCEKLLSIDLSVCKELNSIDSYAFYSCTSLQNILLPDSISIIGKIYRKIIIV